MQPGAVNSLKACLVCQCAENEYSCDDTLCYTTPPGVPAVTCGWLDVDVSSFPPGSTIKAVQNVCERPSRIRCMGNALLGMAMHKISLHGEADAASENDRWYILTAIEMPISNRSESEKLPDDCFHGHLEVYCLCPQETTSLSPLAFQVCISILRHMLYLSGQAKQRPQAPAATRGPSGSTITGRMT